MHGQLQTSVLAAHYRVMPGRQQLQQQQQHHTATTSNGNGNGSNSHLESAARTDGRVFAGFSFNADFAKGGAEMIFYEFAGRACLAC